MQQLTHAPAAPSGGPAAHTLLGLDRFTLGLGIAVATLVPLLFVLVLTQPRATPLDESSPAGVAHNYYLAAQQDDLRGVRLPVGGDSRLAEL
jgi:hypothetical protein